MIRKNSVPLRSALAGFLLSVPFLAYANERPADFPSEEVFVEEMERPLERSFNLAMQAIRQIPRDRFSVEAVLEREENPTVETVFRWVQNETDLIPYRGILRAGRGVLMDRMGNSLDRALLLHDLLKESGHEELRLANGRLTREEAAELYELSSETRTIPDTPPPLAEETVAQALRDASRVIQTDPTTLRHQLEENLFRSQAAAEELWMSINLQIEELESQFPLAHSSQANRKLAEKAVESLRDHWWVEAEIDGEWVALDPANPEADIGETAFQVSSDQTFAREDLDENLWHRMTVSVIAEQLSEGKLTETPALEHEIIVARLKDYHLQLTLQPMAWQDVDVFDQGNAGKDETMEAALDQTEWWPVLTVDGERFQQASIRRDGSINENPTRDARSRALESASGMLGQISIGSGNKKEKGTGQLTAAWLEIVIDSPGENSLTIRRAFTDLIGPANRQSDLSSFELDDTLEKERALGMLGRTSIVPQTLWFPDEWVEFQSLLSMVDNRSAMMGLLRAAYERDNQAINGAFGQFKRFPIALYRIGQARWQQNPDGPVTYPDGINLLAETDRLSPGKEESSIVFRHIIDIMRNEVSAKPGEDALAVTLTQGIVDTNVEDILHPEASGRLSGVNTANQYNIDLMTGTEWILTDSLSELEPIRDLQSADTIARWQSALDSGRHLLVRPEPVEMADTGKSVPVWWEWDPQSGQLLGYGADGRGNTEYLETLNIGLTVIMALYGTGACIATESGWDLVCCLVQHAALTGAGMGFGHVLGAGLAASNFELLYSAIAWEVGASQVDVCP